MNPQPVLSDVGKNQRLYLAHSCLDSTAFSPQTVSKKEREIQLSTRTVLLQKATLGEQVDNKIVVTIFSILGSWCPRFSLVSHRLASFFCLVENIFRDNHGSNDDDTASTAKTTKSATTD
jgi:hypothetical protein